MTVVTQSESAMRNGNAQPASDAQAYTRARARATVTQRARNPLAWVGRRAAAMDRVWVFSDAPPSVAQLRAYVHAAEWVPGDVPLLEVLGRVYGYLVAIPATWALYGVAWVLQRPTRVLVAAMVAVLVWLTA